MSNKEKLVWIFSVTCLVSLVLSWLAFHPLASTMWLDRPGVIAVFLALCVLPIYPLLRARKNLPRSVGAPILLAVGSLIAEAAYIIGRFVIRADAEWVTMTGTLNKILLLSSMVAGIWVGYSQRRG